jgi:proteasome alpha subunit
VSMPFYVSPEQVMKDKADFARKAIARIRSGVVLTCEPGILFVAPNPSRTLRKFGEIYDRIAFAAVGRYNEFESLRKAGVRYADTTGFQYDRQDVTARGLANWYGQLLGTLFTDSNKPYEVEIVVAEVGKIEDDDQIYRITFEGSVAEEHGFVVMGGQADKVAGVLKEHYSAGMDMATAMGVAMTALENQGDGEKTELSEAHLEVALLDRSRPHRTFRRLSGSRLEELLAQARPGHQAAPIGQPSAGESSSADEPSDGSGDDAAGADGAEADTDGGAK